MIKEMLIVTREGIEDNTKNIKVHLECTHILDLLLLNAFIGQEKLQRRARIFQSVEWLHKVGGRPAKLTAKWHCGCDTFTHFKFMKDKIIENY